MLTALFLFYLACFFAAFVWPAWRIWRRTGLNPIVLSKDDSAGGVVGNWFRLVPLALFGAIAAATAGAPARTFGPLPWLEGPAPRFIGWVLMILALAWTVVAQAQMGRSWRVGIDSKNQPPLIREGLFALSRNPIFLGMRINLLGVLLAWPNALTLSALLLGEVLMQVQVRLEEHHLQTVIGEPYIAYRSAVRRWL